MIIKTTSRKSIEQLREELPAACQEHGFGVLHVHDLREKLREKGQEFDRAVVVFDVCNPVKAKQVLEAEAAISAALPCRISAYETPSGTEMVTIRPSGLIGLFDTPELEETAREVEETLDKIMRTAAGGDS